MNASPANQGHRTRNTVHLTSSVSEGYYNLAHRRQARGTARVVGLSDDQRRYLSTEFRDLHRDRTSPDSPFTIEQFAASGTPGGETLWGYLTGLLLASSQTPRGTETTESPPAVLADWSNWHSLRAKASAGELTPREVEELAILTAQAEVLDAEALSHQIRSISPVVQRHREVLGSLSRVATLLLLAIEEAEHPRHENGHTP